MVAIFDFWSEWFQLFWSTSHPEFFLSSLKTIGLWSQEKKQKIDFQNGDRHLGFPIGTIFTVFYLRHLNASYQVSSQLAFHFRRRREKYIFKMAAMAAILDCGSEWF